MATVTPEPASPEPAPVARRAPPRRVAGACAVFGDTDTERELRKRVAALAARNAELTQQLAAMKAQARKDKALDAVFAAIEWRTRQFVTGLSERDPARPAWLVTHVEELVRAGAPHKQAVASAAAAAGIATPSMYRMLKRERQKAGAAAVAAAIAATAEMRVRGDAGATEVATGPSAQANLKAAVKRARGDEAATATGGPLERPTCKRRVNAGSH